MRPRPRLLLWGVLVASVVTLVLASLARAPDLAGASALAAAICVLSLLAR